MRKFPERQYSESRVSYEENCKTAKLPERAN